MNLIIADYHFILQKSQKKTLERFMYVRSPHASNKERINKLNLFSSSKT
ncbi:hypothetical protein RV14_GL001892 [Enterococcus ratti]|uniref:Uncharacterized protein n=1 Tax=Enterococcus ratti TaxID=150033 RepID=A0A1L8WQC4_9ENTE|nr:hypothetical protein RV14_GL001892 [Enterococcus ratti]